MFNSKDISKQGGVKNILVNTENSKNWNIKINWVY